MRVSQVAVMNVLTCSGCGEVVARMDEENHARLSAMQAHDRECLSHDFNGVPCRHNGSCYREVSS